MVSKDQRLLKKSISSPRQKHSENLKRLLPARSLQALYRYFKEAKFFDHITNLSLTVEPWLTLCLIFIEQEFKSKPRAVPITGGKDTDVGTFLSW